MCRAVGGTALVTANLTTNTQTAHTELGAEGRSRAPEHSPGHCLEHSAGLSLEGPAELAGQRHPASLHMSPDQVLHPGALTKHTPEATPAQRMLPFSKVHKDTYGSESRVSASSSCPFGRAVAR